ncbi:MAG: ArnT family glycosyltransferase [Acidimicrobiales bacterium]
MTPTAVAPSSFAKSGPGWRHRLESIPLRRLRGFGIAAVVVGLTGVVQAVNMTAAPGRHSAEGMLVSRAWIVETTGSLGRVTDWYDHPPLGWLLLSGWTSLTGAFERAPSAVAAGRELALVALLVTAGLVWVLARRLRLARWSSGLAMVLVGLSPLAVELHRQVSLDNLAVPWIVAAFVLACPPRRQLAAFAASGGCLAAAVLTHEAALLLVPMLAWQVARSSLPSTRRYSLVLAGSVFVLAVGAYAVGAALSGELVAGDGHAGLVDGVRSQLVARPSLSSAPLLGVSPFDVDPVAVVAMLVAGPVALIVVPRLRPVALSAVVLSLLAVGPLDVRPALLVELLPFGAVTIAGLADHGWRRRATARPPFAVAALAVTGVVVAAVTLSGWVGEHRRLLTDDEDRGLDGAEAWIVANVPDERRLIVDDALWVDLVERGFPANHLVGYQTLPADPDVGWPPAGRWSDYRLVVVSESLRASSAPGDALNAALRHSVPLAEFGSGRDLVEIRTVVPEGPSGAADANHHDRVAAASSGAALARNPSLDLAPSARDALVAGDVDQRLMTTLVALAVDFRLEVAAFTADPAELDSGSPHRIVEMRAASGADAQAIADLLAHQQAPYRPAAVDIEPDQTVTVTYRPAAVI